MAKGSGRLLHVWIMGLNWRVERWWIFGFEVTILLSREYSHPISTKSNARNISNCCLKGRGRLELNKSIL